MRKALPPTILHAKLIALPPRMRVVAVLLLGAYAEKQIAQRLGLSVHTVHDYAKYVYRHYDVPGRVAFMALWIEMLKSRVLDSPNAASDWSQRSSSARVEMSGETTKGLAPTPNGYKIGS